MDLSLPTSISLLLSWSPDDLKVCRVPKISVLPVGALPDCSITSTRCFNAVIPESLLSITLSSIDTITRRLLEPHVSLVVLIPYVVPPRDVRRYDGIVTSFACHHSLLQSQDGIADEPGPRWCYRLLCEMLHTAGKGGVVTLQIPAQEDERRPVLTLPATVAIIPHRGPEEYLNVCLDHVKHMMLTSLGVRCSVGLDVDDVEPYLHLLCRNELSLFVGRTPPAGPYVFREAMITVAPETLVLFQDSDDIPTVDRGAVLHQHLAESGSDMVGSHELEVNEIDEVIRVYRFPLDVNTALSGEGVSGVSDNALEAFLHATALIRRDAFKEAGGFSTNRRIANDSQFLLRAFFKLKIKNVDAFLYVRRVHKRALTVADETRNGNDLRKSLSGQWGADFKLIKLGKLEIDESSLVAIKAPTRIERIQ